MRMGRRTESTSKKKKGIKLLQKKKSWDELTWDPNILKLKRISFEVHSKQSLVHFKTTLLIVSPTMLDSQTFKYSFQLLPQTPLYCVSTIKQFYCTLLWCSNWCFLHFLLPCVLHRSLKWCFRDLAFRSVETQSCRGSGVLPVKPIFGITQE